MNNEMRNGASNYLRWDYFKNDEKKNFEIEFHFPNCPDVLK